MSRVTFNILDDHSATSLIHTNSVTLIKYMTYIAEVNGFSESTTTVLSPTSSNSNSSPRFALLLNSSTSIFVSLTIDWRIRAFVHPERSTGSSSTLIESGFGSKRLYPKYVWTSLIFPNTARVRGPDLIMTDCDNLMAPTPSDSKVLNIAECLTGPRWTICGSPAAGDALEGEEKRYPGSRPRIATLDTSGSSEVRLVVRALGD